MEQFCPGPQTQQLSQDPCPSMLHNQQMNIGLPQIQFPVIKKENLHNIFVILTINTYMA